MDLRSGIETTLTVLLVVIALALVAGQLLGQPLLIGYVETGSMEPTLEIGDGFVAIPTWLAGEISEGDVVTFEAQSIGGGGMTTHRVTEETPEGYVTRGDANSFDDQEASEPPVQEAQIVAVVLQINGEVIVLPSIGDGAVTVQDGIRSALAVVGLDDIGSYGIAATTTGVGVVLITLALLYDMLVTGNRPTNRISERSELVNSGWILLAIILVLLLPLMTSMLVPSDTTSIQVMSVASSAENDPTRIVAGETETVPYTIQNNVFVPKVVVVESESQGVAFSESVVHVSHGETREISLELSVPDEYGFYSRSRAEHHYLHVLPTPIIVFLHNIHPNIAMLTISGVIISPVILLFLLIIGIRPISIRPVHD